MSIADYNGPVARRRFFVDRIDGDRAELTGDGARHLARVLRAEPGQRYELSDNHQLYLAEIAEVAPKGVTFRIVEALPAGPAASAITLYAALIKFDRFEWMIEKATELGVARIVPINTDRTEKGLDTAARKRAERWRKIARESSEQSRRLTLPEIAPADTFANALHDASRHRYFLEEQPGAEPLFAALPPSADRKPADVIALLVGPEGGWTDREREAARAAGWRAVSLARNILRAETAAVAALAVLLGCSYEPPAPDTHS
ncbi:MAG TPA: RsmE family RNA methyltransferase [Bryobacteraceae bacterium]|nr:RsmE family RNA methyltransferase [Bryobacteraceae bacterium]